jgi:uncharacterized membrane protein
MQPLSFGNPGGLAMAIPLFVVAAFLAVLSLRRTSLGTRARFACLALRLMAVLLIAVLLIEPLWSSTRAVPGENLLLMLADDSRSLTVPDRIDTDALTTPAARLRALLKNDEKTPWQSRLGEDFALRRFRFDAGVHATEDFSTLKAEGDGTQLKTALNSLTERFRGRPVAGVLLFTDGTSTDLDRIQQQAKSLPPIYPVLIADDRARQPDLAIETVAINHSPFEDAPVTVQVDVAGQNLKGHSIRARLAPTTHGAASRPSPRSDPATPSAATDSANVSPSKDSSSRLEQTQPLSEEGRASFRFEIHPSASGPQFYAIDVAALANDNPSEPARELTLENNHRVVCLNSPAAAHRILYVSGRPNWEFKFLNRAIADDRQLQLAGLIRIAKREAKFDFRGRAGESSNALFRGFQKDANEETERFDEPVIVRVNMKDGDELRKGFPKTADELFAFRAIILDDIEAAFFTHDQLALLERFVSERGGGLMMLGGQESFAEGGYAKTALAPALPVYMTPRSMAETPRPQSNVSQPMAEPSDVVRLELTRDGWLLPWTRLRRSEADEQQRLAAMPGFRTVNDVAGVRPGATIAAVTQHGGKTEPALVVQRFGRGLSAALTIGDMWRWQLRRAEGTDDLARAWRQTLRYLVADVPELFDLKVAPLPDDACGRVQVTLRARDRNFQPLDNADVRFTVTAPDGSTTTLAVEASTDEAGVYRAEFAPAQPGGYVASAIVHDAAGRELSSPRTGWVHDPAADEFRTINPQREALKKLAEATGGMLVEPAELDRFAEQFPRRNVPVMETTTWPLWHNAWWLLLIVACLGGEWAVRRKLGLP